MEKHFESFLADCLGQGHTQVKLVPRFHEPTGGIAFYAVGQCGPNSGETFEAVVSGKHVRRMVEMEDTPVVLVSDFTDEELEVITLTEASVADVE